MSSSDKFLKQMADTTSPSHCTLGLGAKKATTAQVHWGLMKPSLKKCSPWPRGLGGQIPKPPIRLQTTRGKLTRSGSFIWRPKETTKTYPERGKGHCSPPCVDFFGRRSSKHRKKPSPTLPLVVRPDTASSSKPTPGRRKNGKQLAQIQTDKERYYYLRKPKRIRSDATMTTLKSELSKLLTLFLVHLSHARQCHGEVLGMCQECNTLT